MLRHDRQIGTVDGSVEIKADPLLAYVGGASSVPRPRARATALVSYYNSDLLIFTYSSSMTKKLPRQRFKIYNN